MKFQFSLATLLICVTVFAVVCALSISIKIHEVVELVPYEVLLLEVDPAKSRFTEFDRLPVVSEVIWRLAYWGLPAIVATLIVLSIARRIYTQPRD